MRLGWRTKGLPPRAEGMTGAEIGRLGLSLFDGDLMMPVALIREDALRDNIREMQAFADRHQARLCPHGKTTMSPEIFALQAEAGAWGMTAATAHHVRVYRRSGVKRIILANQLAAPADIAFVLDELAGDSDFDFYCLADSTDAVDLLAGAAAAKGLVRPVQLLVETGFPGGRAGVRSSADALALARHIAANPRLALRGVETFEGIRQTRDDARDEAGTMLGLAVVAAEEIAHQRLFAPGPVLLSAGGSAFLDLCAAQLPAQLAGYDVQRVLRPGCYVTHDSGIYARLTRASAAQLPEMRSALEVWAVILSVPEPGRAIAGAGKRDLSFDVDPPVPLFRFRPGTDAEPRAMQGAATVALWDQHAALSCPGGALQIGDYVGFGISHPCATFDRWTALLTVDGQRQVTGAVTTIF
jgi:D-serine dehydratase